ncbi:hypothetical protein GCM10010129_72820 [Streptomyces fumigatiscleroticus]|nr:hypothetical protein GCM10010129_72820 [Streptomyces fumigatiscleroticus]
MTGFADRLRAAEAKGDKGGRRPAVPATMAHDVRTAHLEAVHRRLPDLRQVLDGTAALPAQRKARREYENRVNALPAASTPGPRRHPAVLSELISTSPTEPTRPSFRSRPPASSRERNTASPPGCGGTRPAGDRAVVLVTMASPTHLSPTASWRRTGGGLADGHMSRTDRPARLVQGLWRLWRLQPDRDAYRPEQEMS